MMESFGCFVTIQVCIYVSWTCSSICKWFKYFLKLLQAVMHGAWWMLGNLHMFFLLVMEPKVMWNYTFAMQTFYAKLLFNLHWLKLFACWSYQRSRVVADPTFPHCMLKDPEGSRDRSTNQRYVHGCKQQKLGCWRISQCCGPSTSFWSWVMWTENTHENTKSYLQDIATYSTVPPLLPFARNPLRSNLETVLICIIHPAKRKREDSGGSLTSEWLCKCIKEVNIAYMKGKSKCWCHFDEGSPETFSGVSHWPTATSTSTAVSGSSKSTISDQDQSSCPWLTKQGSDTLGQLQFAQFQLQDIRRCFKTSCSQTGSTWEMLVSRLGSKTWNSHVA